MCCLGASSQDASHEINRVGHLFRHTKRTRIVEQRVKGHSSRNGYDNVSLTLITNGDYFHAQSHSREAPWALVHCFQEFFC